jgi:hypothetical protein
MKVKELVEILKKFDENATVVVWDFRAGGLCDVNIVYDAEAVGGVSGEVVVDSTENVV